MGEYWNGSLSGKEPLMTYVEIRDAVAALAVCHGDPEVAHGEEDNIHVQALRTIQATSTDVVSQWIATEALKTCDIDFPRWYA